MTLGRHGGSVVGIDWMALEIAVGSVRAAIAFAKSSIAVGSATPRFGGHGSFALVFDCQLKTRNAPREAGMQHFVSAVSLLPNNFFCRFIGPQS
jgi:hypothetical protein